MKKPHRLALGLGPKRAFEPPVSLDSSIYGALVINDMLSSASSPMDKL